MAVIPGVTARDARRRCVLERLIAAPKTVTHVYETDDAAHPEYVVLTLAIRDVGTCELSIPRERYDGFKLIEIIEREQGR